ncbi:MAG: MoaD/ThiS family protein [Caldisericaceae bacterium]
MEIKVLFFGPAERITGKREINLSFGGQTLYDLKIALLRLYPEISSVLETSMLAINREYCQLSTCISDGDEVAIIPPVGGG